MGRSLDVGNEAGTEKRFGKTWARVPTTRIEDLADAVFGGGLEAMQMSLPRVAGSLAFAEHDGVLYSNRADRGTGCARRAPLSESMITFGPDLKITPGSRHWPDEVATVSRE